MEEKLNLYFYPLQRLKVYEEPNKIEVALTPLKERERKKDEGIESLNCRPVENPHMVYDPLNSNILNEIKNFYANDKVYQVVGSNDGVKGPQAKGSPLEGEEEENDQVDMEIDNEEGDDADDCYYTDEGDANPDEEHGEAPPTGTALKKNPLGDQTMSNKRDKSNKKQMHRCSGREGNSQKMSDRKRAMKSCIDFLHNSRNYEREIRRDYTRVRASLDVVNTLATFYIDKSMQLDSRYAYDLRFNVKCPVLVMPGGFYNNEVKLMETQIGECIYDDSGGKGESGFSGDYLPVNFKFCFDNEVTIVPTNLSTGNYDANERGLLPTYYRYEEKVKLAKEYNRKRSYRNAYKLENNHLLYKLDRSFTEQNQKESISVSKYLKIKEIKTDTNNINETVVYARNDVGLIIFQVKYAPRGDFQWDDPLWREGGEEDTTYDKGASHDSLEEAFPVLDYRIKIAKDILLFDRLMQICPSTWTYGRCTLLGNYNSLYSYDLETNLIEIVELKQRLLGYFKKYDTALCLCYLQDDNTLLLGCRALYIYDKREKYLSKFATNLSGVKRITKKAVRLDAREHFPTGVPQDVKTNQENIFYEDKNKSHFNRGYTAVATNPHFSFIVASVNSSFNVIEVWDLRNQYEPVFIFPLNISEFTESHFRHIEWFCITPSGQDKYEQRMTYNLVTFSYYEHMVYVRRILIRDDFTSYKDLGMQAYTNESFRFAYNYTFKGEPSRREDDQGYLPTATYTEPVDAVTVPSSLGQVKREHDSNLDRFYPQEGNSPPNVRTNNLTGYSANDPVGDPLNDDGEKSASSTKEEDLLANQMHLREDISYNHLFSYKPVKMHVEESLLVDTAKFTPMQKNKTESIRLISDRSKYNSINTNMYNLFFGIYGMKFVQLCVPVLYCAREARLPTPRSNSPNQCNGNRSPEHYLEERFYFDGKNTQTWKYFVKKKNPQKRGSSVRRQEIVGIKFDYVQFIFHTNSSGQLFCTPVNLCVKNLPQEQAKGWIPINRSYVVSTYRNEGIPAMLSKFADLVQNKQHGEETNQRGVTKEQHDEATPREDHPKQLADTSPSPNIYSNELEDEFNFFNLNHFEGLMSNGVDDVERDTHTIHIEEKKKSKPMDGEQHEKATPPMSNPEAAQPINFLHLNKDNYDMLKHTPFKFSNVTHEFLIHLFKLLCRDKILVLQNNTNVIKIGSLKKGFQLSRTLALKIKTFLQRELSSPNSPSAIGVEELSDHVNYKTGETKSLSEGKQSSFCDSFRVPPLAADALSTQDRHSSRFSHLGPAPANGNKEEAPNGEKKMTNQDASSEEAGEGSPNVLGQSTQKIPPILTPTGEEEDLPAGERGKRKKNSTQDITQDVTQDIAQTVIQKGTTEKGNTHSCTTGKTSKRAPKLSDLIIERMQEWTRCGKPKKGKSNSRPTTNGTTRKKGKKKEKKATTSQCRNSETLCSKHNVYELFAKYNVRAQFKHDVIQTNLDPHCSYVNVNYLNKTFFREKKYAFCTFHFNKFFYVQTMADLKLSAYGLTDQMRNQFVRDSCPYVTYSPNFQPSRILQGGSSGGGGSIGDVREISNHNEKLFYEQSAFNFKALLLNLLGKNESAATANRGMITHEPGDVKEKCPSSKRSDHVEEEEAPPMEVNQDYAEFGQITNFLSPNEGYTFDAMENLNNHVEADNVSQQSEPQISGSDVNPFGNFVQNGGEEEIGDFYKAPQEAQRDVKEAELEEVSKRRYPLSVLRNAHNMKELLCLYNQGGLQHILDTMRRAKLGKKKKGKKKKKKKEKRLKKLCEGVSKELNKCVSVKNFLFYDAPICFCLYGNDPNNKRQYNTYINSYTFLFDVVRFFGNNAAVGNEIGRLYLHGRMPSLCEKESDEMAVHCLSEEGDQNGQNLLKRQSSPQVGGTADGDPLWEYDPFERLRRANRINHLGNREGLPNYDHLLHKFKRDGLLLISKDITYETFQHMLQNEYYIPVPKYMKNDIKMKEENFQCTPVSCFKNHVIGFYNKKLSDVYNSIDFRDLKNFDMHQYVYHEYFNLSGIQTGTTGSATLNKYIDHGEGKYSNSAAKSGFKGGYKMDCSLLNKLYRLWPSESHGCESREDYLEMMKTLENRKKAIFHK
ncbi:Uncharacterized protein PCOAH_00012060 [Plasmodium coatneyi]|uniref:Uncharacterized protein n=1 Tax=Plasmodium coatneyi TaxID=208452 RepID=A0A1B1DW14_9APIC|nr:Uncharacterized protein PCOAH_00012060 [Plasmodium coatneyi]ANQ06944.1 Uncharacterized protein PCOAH_00012060 [Plasmodium coatneyi]